MAISIAKAQPVQQKEFPESKSILAAEEVNLLENGGLEEWDSELLFPYGSIKGWSCPNNTSIKKESEIVCEGAFSAKMQSKEKGLTEYIEQRIPVTPGQKIRIRFSFYVEQWKTGGARTFCYFRTDAAEKYNISADELQAFYGKEQYYIIRGGGYGKTYFPHDLNVWQTFDETVEVPPTAHYFVFGVRSYFGTTIYVDDCWVTDVTETTLKGDVNGDTEVDANDVSDLISYLLGNTPEDFTVDAADINGDGKVDIRDVTALIDVILGQ